MAAFISSIDTGFLPLRYNIPLSSRTERVAATMLNSPFPTRTNSMRSPASTPSSVRTCTGIVICPLEVRIAAAIPFPFNFQDSLHYSKESIVGQFLPCPVTRTPAPPAESPDTAQTLSSRFPAPAPSGSSCPVRCGPASSTQSSEQTSDHALAPQGWDELSSTARPSTA